MTDTLRESLLALITETATNLPADVRQVLKRARHKEKPDTQASQALHIINLNVDMAKDNVFAHLSGYRDADVLRPYPRRR